MSRFSESQNYEDKIQDSVEEEGVGPDGEEMSLTQGDEDLAGSTTSIPVQVDEEAAEEEGPQRIPTPPVQVEKDTAIFVPFEDFEGRINDDTFYFVKDVPVKVTLDQARTWTDAKKGYIAKQVSEV